MFLCLSPATNTYGCDGMGRVTQKKREEEAPLSRVVPAAVPQEAVMESLIRTANDKSIPNARRVNAIDELKKFPSERVTGALIMLTRDGDPEVRKEAVCVLSERKDARALDCLIFSLRNDSVEAIRWQAMLSLKEYALSTSRRDAARIARELADAGQKDPAKSNREFAIIFLKDIAKDMDTPMTTRQLIVGYLSLIALSNDHKDVRIEAILGLGDIGRPSPPIHNSTRYALFVSTIVAPALLLACQSKDTDISRAAREMRERVLEWEKTMKIRKESGKP